MALMSAICDMSDAHLLAHRGDELSIWPLPDSQPREFLIEAEWLINRWAKALARDFEREDRRQA